MQMVKQTIKDWLLTQADVSSGPPPALPGPFTARTGGPYFKSTSVLIPAGTSAITVAFKFTPTTESLQSLFEFSDGAISAFKAYTNSVGAINYDVRDGTGTDVLASTRTGKHKITPDVQQTIVVSVSLAGSLKITKDIGGAWSTVGSAPVSANDGEFAAGQFLHLLRTRTGAYQFIGEMDYVRVWWEQAADFHEPTRTPDYEITGPKSTVNAHPWKLGDDAITGLGYASYTPVAGSWTEANSAVPYTSVYGGGKISVAHVGDDKLTRWNTTVPAAGNFDVVLRVKLSLLDDSYISCGAWAGTSSGGDQWLEAVGYASGERRARQWWKASNNTNTPENTLEYPVTFPPSDKVEYWRITRTGTAITWYRSDDGLTWVQNYIEEESVFGGAIDRVGFLLNTNAVGAGKNTSCILEGYDDTGPQPEATA